MRYRRAADNRTQHKHEFSRPADRDRGKLQRIEVIETHFARVFLVDALAYKLKKPVRTPAMDYRTVAQRERGCRNELRLNRRLAPSVYLDVVPVMRRRDGVSRGPRVVDWVVKMRRLPAARMLDRAILEHTVTERDLRVLSALLSAFFQNAQAKPMSATAYLRRLRLRTRQNHRDLCAHDLGLSSLRTGLITHAQLEFIACSAAHLGGRGVRLIDGHGDLRPEHVYLGSSAESACVIDCLEFDRDLRRLDPAEELAFLSLECARLGADRLGSDLLRRVQRSIGDPVAAALTHFYMSQCAVVRAKIAAWHLRDPSYAHHPRLWRGLANAYLTDALYYVRLALRERTAYSSNDTGQRRSRADMGLPAIIRRRTPPKSAAVDKVTSFLSGRELGG